MSDHSTSQASQSDSEQDYTHTYLEESTDPEAKYDKLYTCIVKDARLGPAEAMLYGIMRGISRKSGQVNASNTYLAEATGMSKATVSRALKKLIEAGLTKCRYRRHDNGTDRRCSFPPLSNVYVPTNQNDESTNRTHQNDSCPTNQNDSQTIRSTTHENEMNHRGRTHAHARGDEDDESRSRTNERAPQSTSQPKGSMAHSRPRNVNTGVSNSFGPWWEAYDGIRIAIFEHIWSHWPKQTYKQDAMVQFEGEFAAQFGQDPDFGNTLWRIVQWQIEQYEKEETEVKYIPSLANWIKRGLWKDAPEGVTN